MLVFALQTMCLCYLAGNSPVTSFLGGFQQVSGEMTGEFDKTSTYLAGLSRQVLGFGGAA